MTRLEEYWGMIQRREVVVGYWIRQEIRNLIPYGGVLVLSLECVGAYI